MQLREKFVGKPGGGRRRDQEGGYRVLEVTFITVRAVFETISSPLYRLLSPPLSLSPSSLRSCPPIDPRYTLAENRPPFGFRRGLTFGNGSLPRWIAVTRCNLDNYVLILVTMTKFVKFPIAKYLLPNLFLYRASTTESNVIEDGQSYQMKFRIFKYFLLRIERSDRTARKNWWYYRRRYKNKSGSRITIFTHHPETIDFGNRNWATDWRKT